jgi:hypothetical protein
MRMVDCGAMHKWDDEYDKGDTGGGLPVSAQHAIPSIRIGACMYTYTPEQCKAWQELQQGGVPLPSIYKLAEEQRTNQAATKNKQVGKHGCGLGTREETTQQERRGDEGGAKQGIEQCLDA